ncbi:MAG: DUF6173 family protein [Alphaproteobacteria bacterium]
MTKDPQKTKPKAKTKKPSKMPKPKAAEDEIVQVQQKALTPITDNGCVPEKTTAQSTFERLSHYIMSFEESLDDNHEVGGRMVSFGSNLQFHITSIGYYEPDIICFYGLNKKGEKMQLIQHVSQLSVLLVAVKKMNKKQKPRRIGFDLAQSVKIIEKKARRTKKK